MIDKYEVELERARAIAVLFENELYAVRKLIEQEFEYCRLMSRDRSDECARRGWELAAHKLQIILWSWEDMADRV